MFFNLPVTSKKESAKTPKALTSELNGNRCLFEIDRMIAAILLDQDSHNPVNRIWAGICTDTNFVQL